jgi:thymidylate synthase (FAD)
MKNIQIQLITKPDFDIPAVIGGLAKLTQYKKEFKQTSHEDGLKVMKALVDMGHTSLLECADFGFIFGSTSRVFLAQITRHRVASYTSGSQQYQDHDNFPYVIPDSIANEPGALQMYERCMQEIDSVYTALKNNFNIPKDDARFLLPGGASNHLYAKFNLREIVCSIIPQRACRRNTLESRRNIQKMLQSMCEAGFEECIKLGGCACINGGCNQGKMFCGKPFSDWNDMVYGL